MVVLLQVPSSRNKHIIVEAGVWYIFIIGWVWVKRHWYKLLGYDVCLDEISRGEPVASSTEGTRTVRRNARFFMNVSARGSSSGLFSCKKEIHPRPSSLADSGSLIQAKAGARRRRAARENRVGCACRFGHCRERIETQIEVGRLTR